MALKTTPDNKSETVKKVKPGARLWLTKDGSRLVNDGDPECAVLYCTEGKWVPKAEFDALVVASEDHDAKLAEAAAEAKAEAEAEAAEQQAPESKPTKKKASSKKKAASKKGK